MINLPKVAISGVGAIQLKPAGGNGDVKFIRVDRPVAHVRPSGERRRDGAG